MNEISLNKSIGRVSKLMSIYVKCYNQKDYIADCLNSVFAQTYNPLEIVISDDCSTDGSWEIICELVAHYRKDQGGHQIIMNRNDRNLGNAMNCEKAIGLCHGELCFQVDGDDMHCPDRVEYVVKEYEKAGASATLIWNGWYAIDEKSKVVQIGTMPHIKYPYVYGAVMAYKRGAIDGFIPVTNEGYYDDVVLGHRAMMKSDYQALVVDKPLTIYRLGGVSNGTGKKMVQKSYAAYCGIRRLEKDLERCKGNMAAGKYEEIQGVLHRRENLARYDILKYGGKTMWERYEGYRNHPFGRGPIPKRICWLLYVLFPNTLGRHAIAFYEGIKGLYKHWKYRHVSIRELLR